VRARYEDALGAGGTSVYEPSQREWGLLGPGRRYRRPSLDDPGGAPRLGCL